MQTKSSVIPTKYLSISDVPYAKTNMKKIIDFALTFDPNELEDRGANIGKLDDLSEQSTLSILRAHLFFEQRRWNHYGRYPDQKAESQFRKIIELIRERLQQEAR